MKRLRTASSSASAIAETGVIDGFRGVAIALVLLYHTWLFSWFTPELGIFGFVIPIDAVARTGYLGVELFFAISAFVLFLPWARRARTAERRPPQTTAAFAYRRFIKIVPSYYIALLATLASAASLHVALPLGTTAIDHALFLTNSVTSELGRVNSVFWSLGVEVQFYIVFPFLARAFVRRPLPVALLMFACALGYRYGISGCCLISEPINRQLPAFADVFGAGMLAAYGVAVVERRYAARARPGAFATMLTLVAAAVGLALVLSANKIQYDVAGREHWILVDRTFVALAAGLALFASCFATPALLVLVVNPLTRFFSIISYNLYLWHTLVLIWILKRHVIPSAHANPYDDPYWKFAYIAAGWTVAIGISTALTYFVERPLLATVKPQSFAFDWRRLMLRAPAARSEKHT